MICHCRYHPALMKMIFKDVKGHRVVTKMTFFYIGVSITNRVVAMCVLNSCPVFTVSAVQNGVFCDPCLSSILTSPLCRHSCDAFSSNELHLIIGLEIPIIGKEINLDKKKTCLEYSKMKYSHPRVGPS